METSEIWRDLYPFPSNFADVGGARYHYIDQGKGQPVLMVHGNPTWSFYWRDMVRGLSSRLRTIAVDHIGCGLSDKPSNYRYTLEQHTSNLVSLIEQLDLRDIVLMVHDWGGAIGLGAATQQPDRFSRLILFNTGAFTPPYVPWRIRICRVPLLGTLAMRGLNLFARAALTMATNKPETMTPEVRAGLLAPYDCWRNRIAIDGFVRDIPLTKLHPTWQVLERLEQQLPTLAHLPVSCFWGMQDWCFNAVCLQRFQQILPTAEIYRFADAGHYVVQDAAGEIIPIVQELLEPSAMTSESEAHS